jgi:hypothetical protein
MEGQQKTHDFGSNRSKMGSTLASDLRNRDALSFMDQRSVETGGNDRVSIWTLFPSNRTSYCGCSKLGARQKGIDRPKFADNRATQSVAARL